MNCYKLVLDYRQMPIWTIGNNLKLVCFKHFEDEAPRNVEESQALHQRLVDRYVHNRLKPEPKKQRTVNGRVIGQHPVATGVLLVDTIENVVMEFGFSIRNYKDAWDWRLGREIALRRLNLSNVPYLEPEVKALIHGLLVQEIELAEPEASVIGAASPVAAVAFNPATEFVGTEAVQRVGVGPAI